MDVVNAEQVGDISTLNILKVLMYLMHLGTYR